MECDNTTGLKEKNESQEQHAASRRIECLYLIAITVIGRFVCYCIGKAIIFQRHTALNCLELTPIYTEF
jgi:hypothetical protein